MSKARPKSGRMKLRAGEKGPVLLSGGNPQIATAEGDAPVQGYIAPLPSWVPGRPFP